MPELATAIMGETASRFFVVSVSVSTSTSAMAAGVGPFRGLFFKTTSSVTMVGFNGNSIVLDAVQKNAIIWIQGNHISVIATATAVFGLI